MVAANNEPEHLAQLAKHTSAVIDRAAQLPGLTEDERTQLRNRAQDALDGQLVGSSNPNGDTPAYVRMRLTHLRGTMAAVEKVVVQISGKLGGGQDS